MAEQRFKTKNFEIGIHADGFQGWFEHEDLGDELGGGLWFQRNDEGKTELIDYDGVTALPKQVAMELRARGYVVDDDCI